MMKKYMFLTALLLTAARSDAVMSEQEIKKFWSQPLEIALAKINSGNFKPTELWKGANQEQQKALWKVSNDENRKALWNISNPQQQAAIVNAFYPIKLWNSFDAEQRKALLATSYPELRDFAYGAAIHASTSKEERKTLMDTWIPISSTEQAAKDKPDSDANAKQAVPGYWQDSCDHASYDEAKHLLTAECKTTKEKEVEFQWHDLADKEYVTSKTSIRVKPGKTYSNINGHLTEDK